MDESAKKKTVGDSFRDISLVAAVQLRIIKLFRYRRFDLSLASTVDGDYEVLYEFLKGRQSFATMLSLYSTTYLLRNEQR